jgi:hypothetical protein
MTICKNSARNGYLRRSAKDLRLAKMRNLRNHEEKLSTHRPQGGKNVGSPL